MAARGKQSTLVKTNIGTRPDGTPLNHFQAEPGAHVLITGPVSGDVTLADGTTYDVTPDVIEVASEAHAGEVSHHIGVRYEDEGHPGHTDGEPFVHECTDHCGSAKRKR